MRHPRRLLWLLVPAAAGIVCVTVGFSAWQLNYFEHNGGTAEESLYAIKYHHKNDVHYPGGATDVEYVFELNSFLDLWQPAPEDASQTNYEWAWKIGTASSVSSSASALLFRNSDNPSIKKIVDNYKAANVTMDGKIIHLYSSWVMKA